MRYIICFHNGEYSPGDGIPIMGKIIRKWLREPYAHVELHRGKIEVSGKSLISHGECFSSRGYGKPTGVSWKKITFSHPERWTIIELPEVIRAGDEEILERCKDIDGCGYDHLGAVFCPNNRLHIRHRYYCIEAVRFVMGYKPYQTKFMQTYNEAIERGGYLLWAGKLKGQ